MAADDLYTTRGINLETDIRLTERKGSNWCRALKIDLKVCRPGSAADAIN